jgi:5-methylcytosine-specific restriction endonuclease McrA
MSAGWRTMNTRRWRTFRLGILSRDNYLCQIRDRRCLDAATEVDHIQPIAFGGAEFDPANCRAACKPCNLDRRVTQPRSVPTPHSSW